MTNYPVEYPRQFMDHLVSEPGFFGYFVEIIGIYIGEAENHKTLIMGDEYVNEPHDPAEVTFSRLEEQVMDINCNVNLLMATLRISWGYLENKGVRMQRKNHKGDQEIGKTQRTN